MKEEREIFGSVTGGLVKDGIGAYVNNLIPYFDSPPVKWERQEGVRWGKILGRVPVQLYVAEEKKDQI